jgi:O-acetyl-ADP-ribose deacetylase
MPRNNNNTPTHVMSSRLTTLAKYKLPSQVSLVVARGSVLDFKPSVSEKAAIVNAANEGCLAGGGVDGAITLAGGPALQNARFNLPVLPGGIRCPTGDAKWTGPAAFGTLSTSYVIHAVGPNYHDFDDYAEADVLLQTAYRASLACALEADLEEVAFSLLSAGAYSGQRSLREILTLGVQGIQEWCSRHEQVSVCSLKSIVMCAFTEREAHILTRICHDLGLKEESAH